MTTVAALAGRWEQPTPSLETGEPPWLIQLRHDASAWVEIHGFPTRHDEDWRYLDLDPILNLPFDVVGRVGAPRRASSLIDTLGLDLGGSRLVFVDGRYNAGLSRIGALPEGVTVGSVAAALAEDPAALEAILAHRPAPYHHAFDALNTALFSDGAFVRIPAGISIPTPIHLAFVSHTHGSRQLSSPRSLILAGPGSRAAVVETHTGIPGATHCTNAVTEIVCEEDAHLDYDAVQDEPDTAFHLSLVDVRLARGSRFASRTVTLGSAVARHELRVLLAGEDAEASLDGLYLPSGSQYHDHAVLVDHAAPRTTSRQHYKGVVAGRGHGVFNGRIVVRLGADGTDAAQTNKNLLLSEQAEVYTRPRLEIRADDVACAHGAAVGQLDADVVFYLRSRGIPQDLARSMLVGAFVEEIIQRISHPALRAYVAGRVTDQVPTGEGDPST